MRFDIARTTILATLLAFGLAAGAAAPAAPKAAATPTTIKAVIAQWKGKDVRITRGGGQVEVKNLVAIGDDFIEVNASEGGDTYFPLSRIRAVNVQGDKLFINLVD